MISFYSRSVHALILTTLAWCPLGAQTSADFGKAATTGQEAHDGIPARGRALHEAMACGNELEFAQRLAYSSRFGKKNGPNKDLAQWPVTLMVGKAAIMLVQDGRTNGCIGSLYGTEDDWAFLTTDQKKHDGEQLVDLVNRAYHDLYDSLDGVNGAACAGVAQVVDPATPPAPGPPAPPPAPQPHSVDPRFAAAPTLRLVLTNNCLARQIRAVMTNPRHGPWTEEDGVVKPELPGTSASALTCLSELKLKIKDFNGDWDMAVIEYTRLTSLLLRFGRSSLSIGADVQASIDVLNRNFLTLRSSPEQGATAREEFNLVTSCGNLPNQFGDAIDTANGVSADPGQDRYSDDAKDAVGKKSFWDDLLRFFAALLIVVGILVAAALAGAIIGAIAGAIGGSVAVPVAVAVAVGVVIAVTFLGGGIQETENHLLMQNTSRYIKNKLMMAELSAQDERKAFDTISDLNEELRSWLLERLQRIAREDFVEYNAKPYNRLSHASILNLLDYACDVTWDYDNSRFILNSDRSCDDKDKAVATAAAAILDLSAAKDAVGSMEGRRLVPYRRLMEQNYQFYIGRSLLELASGADNQLAALQIWTGQMRHAPDGKAAPATFGDLEWYSTSAYRPAPMILDIAVDKSVAHEQQYRHSTRERYVNGNGWLITAGGTDEHPAQGFHSPFGFTFYPPIKDTVNDDRGAGVPTTLMTSALIAGPDGKLQDRARIQEFLRFEGNKKDWGLLDEAANSGGLSTGKPLWSFSDNNCVAGSFACGLSIRMPKDFDETTCRAKGFSREFFIVDSTTCAAFRDGDESTANDIFIAIFRGASFGFFEVAQQDAYGHSLDTFANAVLSNNKDRLNGWATAKSTDSVEYFSVSQNKVFKFTPADEDFGADRRACGVVNHESGARLTISNVPAAKAASCLSVGPRIYLDLNDEKNPIRRGEEGLLLDPIFH